MSGFTLYETLRIFLPGVLGTLALDLVLRFAFGPDALAADGGVRAAVRTLQSPLVAIGVATFLGLGFYLVDLPTKTRLYKEGDPKRFRLPSTTLGDHLRGTPLGTYPKSLSLYFLLSDRYLPPEFHKRVYLFGSLYRVYVDLRFLLALAVTIGISSGLLIASRQSGFVPIPSMDGEASLFVIAVIVSVLLAGSYGVAFYSFAVAAKHDARELARRLRRETAAIAGSCVGLLLLGSLGTALLLSGVLLLGLVGQLLGFGAVTLWSWIEIGPPGRSDGRSDVRSIVLRKLRANTDRFQYSPQQRLLSDLCLFTPWLIAASILYANIGAAVSALLVWGILMVPCTAIMSIGKHELRLLQVFADQSLWLDLHVADISGIGATQLLPDRW